ncbi:MAG: polysaccharide deacetylase family protein [Alphaproteobacteria bacterium]
MTTLVADSTARDEDVADWAALGAELDRWHRAGRTATLWWRDDDARSAGPALDRLLALRRAAGVPLALAVVPFGAERALADRLAGERDVAVLQHGWAHTNIAHPGDRKIELGTTRPAAHIAAELAMGLDALTGWPGFASVLVPPWNRIAPALVPLLPELRFTGLSTAKPRARRHPVRGVVQANIHVDPIDWATRGFAGEARVLGAAVAHLGARRVGSVDADEPTGLLTHHLAQDDATWAFVARFIDTTAAHGGARWLAATDVFTP